VENQITFIQWRRQRSKTARSFWGQKILYPGQVTRNPGRREGLACPQWSDGPIYIAPIAQAALWKVTKL